MVLGSGHASLAAWQTRQLHQLKHEGPTNLVSNLTSFAAEQLTNELVAENLAYLDKRTELMQYPTFQADGWPIGSGIAESANKQASPY